MSSISAGRAKAVSDSRRENSYYGNVAAASALLIFLAFYIAPQALVANGFAQGKAIPEFLELFAQYGFVAAVPSVIFAAISYGRALRDSRILKSSTPKGEIFRTNG